MTIRVGIVGANPDYGWGSGVHRRVIESLPGIALHGVCTTREDSARKAAAVFGAPIWTTSHEDLSAHSEIDVIAKAALQAGKHVYCEWPLAITVAQAEELAALAASGGARTITGLHLRGSPVMRQAARMIAEGFVGRVYSVSLHARLFGPVMRAMALRSGGTTLHSIYGGHLLDGLDHYFGGIAEIAMRGAVHLPPFDETGHSIPRDAFDHVQFHGVLDHGALFNVDLAGVSMTGLGCTWKIEGSDGVLVLSTRDPGLPSIEALALNGAQGGTALQAIPADISLDCAAIPAEPDRYPAYPGVSASREALGAIGNLYLELGEAIAAGRQAEPGFDRAVTIQQMLERLDPTDIALQHLAGVA
jgi:predicted dehydrogenase